MSDSDDDWMQPETDSEPDEETYHSNLISDVVQQLFGNESDDDDDDDDEDDDETENDYATSLASTVEDNGSVDWEMADEYPVIDLNDSQMDVDNEYAVNESSSTDTSQDDIIFVQQSQNNDLVTIDLCNESTVGVMSANTQKSTTAAGVAVEVPTTSKNSKNDSNKETKRKTKGLESKPILDCAICLESVIKREPVSTICGHIFCKSCIEECISLKQKCPLCKKKLSMKKIHRVYLN